MTNDQRGFGSGSPSLSREMFDAIMSGAPLPGSPGGPQIGTYGGRYGFGQPTTPMGNYSQGGGFGAGQHQSSMARRNPRAVPQYAQPQAVPMQAPSARSMGAMNPEEVASLPGFGQGGWLDGLTGFGGIGNSPSLGYGPGSSYTGGWGGGWGGGGPGGYGGGSVYSGGSGPYAGGDARFDGGWGGMADSDTYR